MDNVTTTAPVGLFTYLEFDGRWYVGAEWHFETDTDTPTRIVSMQNDTDMWDVEAHFADGGYDTDADAAAAINAHDFSQ